MRTRSNHSEPATKQARYYVRQYPTYNPIYSNYYTCGYQERHSSISDEPKRVWLGHGRTGSLAYKPVTHTTRDLVLKDEAMTYSYPGPPAGTAYDVLPSMVIAGAAGTYVVDVDPYFLSHGLGQIVRDPFVGHYDRWGIGKPSMATRANLAVFLAELRDIKRMIDILPSKHFRLRDWKEVLKYVNNQHLNYNFGIRPFLSDIGKFTRAVESFDDRLRRFVNNQMRLITRNVRMPEYLHSSTTDITLNSTWKLRRELSYTLKRVSTFQFLYELPEYSYNELLWRAWADSFGANITAANIWALVPWSFMVDWYVDIGGFLDTLSTDWIEPWITFVQGCSSYHVVGDVKLSTVGPAAWGSPHGELGTEHFEEYVRKVGTPNFTWDSETLDADKIRLSASLALSRLL